MANLKCKSCGLVNPLNAAECKRCGASLVAEADQSIPQAPPPSTLPPQEGDEKQEPKSEGIWGCIQVLIVLAIAGTITGYLGIYIMDFLPAGHYPVILLIIIFIPAAVVGLAAGFGVLYVINLVIPGITTPDKKDDANKSS